MSQMSYRWRVRLWRARRPIAAVLVALALVIAVGRLTQPPPDYVPVLVAASQIEVGAALTSGNTNVVLVPPDLAPAERPAFADVDSRVAAVTIPAGLPIVSALLDRPFADLTAPAGTVLCAVQLADDALATLLVVGDHVDLYTNGADGAAVRVAVRGLVVQVVPGQAAGLAGGGSGPVILVAVAEADAAAVAGASAQSPVVAVIVA